MSNIFKNLLQFSIFQKLRKLIPKRKTNKNSSRFYHKKEQNINFHKSIITINYSSILPKTLQERNKHSIPECCQDQKAEDTWTYEKKTDTENIPIWGFQFPPSSSPTEPPTPVDRHRVKIFPTKIPGHIARPRERSNTELKRSRNKVDPHRARNAAHIADRKRDTAFLGRHFVCRWHRSR